MGQEFEKSSNLLNYINGLTVKYSPGKGRGVFATRNLHEGELLIAEKPIAYY